MKVRDLPYARYEVERAKQAFDVAIEAIKNAKSAQEVLDARKTLMKEMEEMGTQSALSATLPHSGFSILHRKQTLSP